MAGSEPAFVGWMNAKARTLGLADTHYVNCNGNHRDPSHHSSVFDLARLGRYAMRNARLPGHRGAAVRDRALGGGSPPRGPGAQSPASALEWADGIKSGLTDAAGFCLVGSGQPGLRPFVTATLKSPSREREGRDHLALFEWASALYAEKTVVTAGHLVAAVPIAGGGEAQVAARTTLTAVARRAAPVRRVLILPERFASRPADGTVVGRAVYRADGVVLGTVKLVVAPAPPERRRRRRGLAGAGRGSRRRRRRRPRAADRRKGAGRS